MAKQASKKSKTRKKAAPKRGLKRRGALLGSTRRIGGVSSHCRRGCGGARFSIRQQPPTMFSEGRRLGGVQAELDCDRQYRASDGPIRRCRRGCEFLPALGI